MGLLVVFWALLTGAYLQGAAVEDFSPLITQLTDLRFVVDDLNGEIERLRDEQQKKLNALAIQHNEVAANLQREELRAQQLAQKIAQVKNEQAARASQMGPELLSTLTASWPALQDYVSKGIPFHRTERWAQLQELQAPALPPHTATLRLWSFLEDELRLATENSLSRQIINLEGQEVIAQVAHLGMVAMFFQTTDGTVGSAGPGPIYQKFSDRQRINAVNDLFSGIKKQIRSGIYWLPNVFSLPSGFQQEGS